MADKAPDPTAALNALIAACEHALREFRHVPNPEARVRRAMTQLGLMVEAAKRGEAKPVVTVVERRNSN